MLHFHGTGKVHMQALGHFFRRTFHAGYFPAVSPKIESSIAAITKRAQNNSMLTSRFFETDK